MPLLNWVLDFANNSRYIGAEDGIYEYQVNVAGRRIFPSLVLR